MSKRRFLDVTKYYEEAEKIATERRKLTGGMVTWIDVLHETIAGGLTLLKELHECDDK